MSKAMLTPCANCQGALTYSNMVKKPGQDPVWVCAVCLKEKGKKA